MTERFVDSKVYDENYYYYNLPKEMHDAPYENLPGRILEIFKMREVEPGMRVLDIGMGRGELCVYAVRRGGEAWGIDYSEVAVKIAEKYKINLPDDIQSKIHYQQGNAKALEFSDNFFDLITMTDVVEHLYPEELEKAFNEIKRVLKPGGRLLLQTAPNRWYTQYGYWIYYLFRKLNDNSTVAHPRDEINEIVHVNEQSVPQLKSMLKKIKFKDFKISLRHPPLQTKNPIRKFGYMIFYKSPLKYILSHGIFAWAEKG